jgi:hypothetical protein
MTVEQRAFLRSRLDFENSETFLANCKLVETEWEEFEENGMIGESVLRKLATNYLDLYEIPRRYTTSYMETLVAELRALVILTHENRIDFLERRLKYFTDKLYTADSLIRQPHYD